jgi:superfamily I DNA and RNA helicase
VLNWPVSGVPSVFESIRRFKGLESPVVLLVIDIDTVDKEELLYAGMTRAQVILEIFGPTPVVRRLRKFGANEP